MPVGEAHTKRRLKLELRPCVRRCGELESLFRTELILRHSTGRLWESETAEVPKISTQCCETSCNRWRLAGVGIDVTQNPAPLQISMARPKRGWAGYCSRQAFLLRLFYPLNYRVASISSMGLMTSLIFALTLSEGSS